MFKFPFHHMSLGVHMKRERQNQKLTQSDLARQAMLSIPTLRLLEHGQGNLTSFWAVLSTPSLWRVERAGSSHQRAQPYAASTDQGRSADVSHPFWLVPYLTDRRQRPPALTGRPDCDCRRTNSRLVRLQPLCNALPM